MEEKSIRAYPLQWPDGWPRIAVREDAKFHTRRHGTSDGQGVIPRERLSIGDGCDRVLRSLSAMGIADHDVVISTNIEPTLYGGPRRSARSPDDPGVALYWKRKGKRQCMAIDRYTRVGDNLAAVAATLDAMRAIDRHGGAQILDRAFTGFIALPAPEQPWQVLGLGANPTREQVKDAHWKLTQKHHPDKGGTDHEMARINAARDALLESL